MIKKQMHIFLMLGSISSLGWVTHTLSEQPLSIVEAACIIWRMNYKDICAVHEAVFPAKQDKELSYIEQTTKKISEIRKAISEKIFGKTVVDRLLQLFFAANPEEQEVLKLAIKGSYEEYIGYSALGVLAAIIIFPIGFPLLLLHQWEHVKKIEAIRARLTEVAEDN
jgi:hypothetical protein